MALEIVGELHDAIRQDVQQFAQEFERHPHGDPVEGRLVVAEPHPGGLRPTLQRALRTWMKDAEFAEWQQQQRGRPVMTAGKVFVADDEVVTAVVCPLPASTPTFLGIATHEIVELANRVREIQEGWSEPEGIAEQHGTVLADEYAVERTRIEVSSGLAWPESPLDADPGLVSQTEDIRRLMEAAPRDGRPPQEFWLHWVNIARVWVMVLGRRDGGSGSADVELNRWASHPLIADNGWRPVAGALVGLYAQNEPIRTRVFPVAAQQVWNPIERYGHEAWATA